mmetsp:Transcript_10733/g.35225  ORF Transcript_10733/g.35225 Transcript_10733/m.35225 type:complete len:282 (+) Transcript_10733:299-1144(+)
MRLGLLRRMRRQVLPKVALPLGHSGGVEQGVLQVPQHVQLHRVHAQGGAGGQVRRRVARAPHRAPLLPAQARISHVSRPDGSAGGGGVEGELHTARGPRAHLLRQLQDFHRGRVLVRGRVGVLPPVRERTARAPERLHVAPRRGGRKRGRRGARERGQRAGGERANARSASRVGLGRDGRDYCAGASGRREARAGLRAARRGEHARRVRDLQVSHRGGLEERAPMRPAPPPERLFVDAAHGRPADGGREGERKSPAALSMALAPRASRHRAIRERVDELVA